MTILDMLKKERLTFGNQLESLEGQIQKQEEEIEKLKVSQQDQHKLLGSVFGTLVKHSSYHREVKGLNPTWWVFSSFSVVCSVYYTVTGSLQRCYSNNFIRK